MQPSKKTKRQEFVGNGSSGSAPQWSTFKNLLPKAPEIFACKDRVMDKARLDLAVNGEDCAEHHVQLGKGENENLGSKPRELA